jgi:SAM-dependent methyltransferase
MRINEKTMDWRAEWIVKSEAKNIPDDFAVWDERSADYAQHSGLSDYAREFIEKLDPEPDASVFDMGAGSGALAIPLAKRGHRVLCGDFSQGMRTALVKRAEEAGVADRVSVRALSWTDDFAAAGIVPKSMDIAVASRSIMVRDLCAAFEKLETVARKRVAITISTRFGPKGRHEIGEMEYGLPYLPDHIYAVNILFDRGRDPSLSYISSVKTNENGEDRLTRWAFIRWDL